jgi:glycosyltransferase involved in cell wall biosynthesis
LWSEQVTWAAELRRRPPDLLVTLAFSPPLASRVPCLMTVHDVAPLERPQDYPGASGFYWGQVLRRAAPRAVRIATPSTWVKEECVRRLGLSPERIDVVYNGVRPLYFDRPSAAAAAALLERLEVRGPFLLHCGILHPRKNLGILIRALGLLRERGREVPWLVSVGSWTSHAEHVLSLASSQGVRDRVVLAGRLVDDELWALYRACDAFAFPSWSEGFGVPPLEAMAGGVPVLAARASCLPEILGETPHWADPADAESWIGAWDEARNETGAARAERARRGKEWASRYTWDDTTARMGAALDRALVRTV